MLSHLEKRQLVIIVPTKKIKKGISHFVGKK